ncbi:hypothetical protein VP1G_09216 [Cytospora mali]|uniref:J domain-containing protein n=1 Tax=Cytospora mali TaxID=578113 RepID=A0A194VDK5_CYTMA|nr:hypothetical protein VP1G_09216 [Valsa mali var. pyri (nom. inval.)]
MRFSVLSLGLLALLTPLTAAWSKEDREIFRLRDELATYEGPDVTFYDFLGVTPSASQDDINKAYRKKSRSLHPDKIKAAVKAASDRQARLSIVANILKGPGRARYDHFMSNGFPVWKGTNYFYERYRPGLGTVMFGVFLALGGGAHYLALYMGWKRQREFVERYIKFARHAAWGDNLGIPTIPAAVDTAPPPPAPEPEQERAMPTNRKMRRMQEREAKKEASQDGSKRSTRKAAPRAAAATPASGAATPTPAAGGPQGAKKRVVAENGKVLVVDSLGDVYLEQEDEEGNVEEFLLDPNEIHKPTISDTALVRMPIWFYGRTVGRLFSKKNVDEEEEYEEIEAEDVAADTDSSSGAGGKRTPSTGSADDDFELLDKSVEDVSASGAAKATGSQPQVKQGKSGKRKSKKR